MVRSAEALPVARIPEQLLIALMGNDVIDHGCRRYSPILLAHDAQGMAHQVGLAGFVPACGVASLSG